MKINKTSLQARVQNLSTQKGVPSNVILQNYFFDAFIKRLASSKYSRNFIFKGGFFTFNKFRYWLSFDNGYRLLTFKITVRKRKNRKSL